MLRSSISGFTFSVTANQMHTDIYEIPLQCKAGIVLHQVMYNITQNLSKRSIDEEIWCEFCGILRHLPFSYGLG